VALEQQAQPVQGPKLPRGPQAEAFSVHPRSAELAQAEDQALEHCARGLVVPSWARGL
jgi:hypothetical protein